MSILYLFYGIFNVFYSSFLFYSFDVCECCVMFDVFDV